jgi:hypothetical protein
MLLNNGMYEYVAVYVDDLLIAAIYLSYITKTLFQFNFKCMGPLQYHLGCDYVKDQAGTLCFGPRKYIATMIKQYKRMFGQKPKKYTSHLARPNRNQSIPIHDWLFAVRNFSWEL